MTTPFNELKIKLSFGCGFIYSRQDEELLSDYWTEEDWNNTPECEKEKWLDEFYLDWKSNYETGGVYIE